MNNSSVVMKSDVSLRRNLSDYNFMLVIDTDSCDDMKSDIKKELNNLEYLKESSVYSFKDTKSTNRDYLRKQGYISSAYYEDVSPEVIINSDKKCVFTLADNDHICITAYDFGKNLRDIYEKC
ncbi:MAG: ATP--guanido phosphotransferase, partial [Finegoldia magna]|nr:ATP--guanido phosphotransferase [Finegoldia magna]